MSIRADRILVTPATRMNAQGAHSALRNRVTNDRVNGKSISSHSRETIKESNDQPDIIEPEDNWIARLLYQTRIGLIINFSVLTIFSLIFIISLPEKISKYEHKFELMASIWFQIWRYASVLDLSLIALILFVFYPLTRVSRSPTYTWMITVICSLTFYVMLAPYYHTMRIAAKLVMVIDCIRLTMKLISYSSECLSSEQVYAQSSMKSLFFFLWAPTLIYRPKYPRTRYIRWTKVLGNFWWGIFIGAVINEFYFAHLESLSLFDLASGPLSTRITNILILYSNILIGYPFVIWFSVFESFCGLHGELLRFPHLKLFGELSNCIQGEKLAAHVNIIVSDWLSRYIYKPIRVRTASRAKALTAAIAFSLFLHEVCGTFVFGTFLPLPYLSWIVIGPMTLYLQRENRLFKYSIALIFAHMIPLYLFGHPLEYIAWHHSSCDKSVSSYPIIPLYASCILNNL